jgi:hypothetical protein
VPNLNSGKPWTALDDQDIRWGTENGSTVTKTADFVCRDRADVEHRILALGLHLPESENVAPLRC